MGGFFEVKSTLIPALTRFMSAQRLSAMRLGNKNSLINNFGTEALKEIPQKVDYFWNCCIPQAE